MKYKLNSSLIKLLDEAKADKTPNESVVFEYRTTNVDFIDAYAELVCSIANLKTDLEPFTYYISGDYSESMWDNCGDMRSMCRRQVREAQEKFVKGEEGILSVTSDLCGYGCMDSYKIRTNSGYRDVAPSVAKVKLEHPEVAKVIVDGYKGEEGFVIHYNGLEPVIKTMKKRKQIQNLRNLLGETNKIFLIGKKGMAIYGKNDR